MMQHNFDRTFMESIRASLNEAAKLLELFMADSTNIEKIAAAGDIMVDGVKNNHKILSCGNGGSMADAMHFAEELTGLFREARPAIPALSISDPSHITCAANDFGFDHIFSRYIEALGQKGDVLLAISTSGNSANLLNAAKTAMNKGMKVIALTGREGGKLAKNCHIEIRAPWSDYSDRTQELHIKIIHCLIEYIEKQMQ